MKHTVSIFLCLIVLMCFLQISVSAGTTHEPFCELVRVGDVHFDRNTDILDVTTMQRILAGLSIKDRYIPLQVSDVNRDGGFDIIDATFMQRYSAHLSAPSNVVIGEYAHIYDDYSHFVWLLDGDFSSWKITTAVNSDKNGNYISGHTGTDISNDKSGANIFAAKDGIVTDVVTSGFGDGYGLHVIILHDNGLATLYAHMSEVSVTKGMHVYAGDTIGKVGSTGHSTGPHLHFECREGFADDALDLSFDKGWFDGVVYSPLKCDTNNHFTFSQDVVNNLVYNK